MPSQIPRIVSLWKDSLAKVSEKAAQSLADPIQYENLFPDYAESVQAEETMRQQRNKGRPTPSFSSQGAAVYQQKEPERVKAGRSSPPPQPLVADDFSRYSPPKPPMSPPATKVEQKPVLSMPPPLTPTAASAPVAATAPPLMAEVADDEFLDPDLDLELDGDFGNYSPEVSPTFLLIFTFKTLKQNVMFLGFVRR